MSTRVRGRVGGGRALATPRGLAVRPTSGRVRKAIFDILGQRCDGDRVLDLYAGTGALAIEAGVRGASALVLVEREPPALRAIHTNLGRVGLDDRAEVIRADAVDAVRRLASRGERFDLILADPPYGTGEIERVLAAIERHPLLAPGGVMVLEHAPREETPTQAGALRRVDQRRYGRTAVSFFREDVAEVTDTTPIAATKGDPT
jgi:16S rRNA (guanine966-N2)-methyltransferase